MRKWIIILLICQGCIVIKPCGCDDKNASDTHGWTGYTITPTVDTLLQLEGNNYYWSKGNSGQLIDIGAGSGNIHFFDKIPDTSYLKGISILNCCGVLTDSLLNADTALRHRLESIKQIWDPQLTPIIHTADLSTYGTVILGGNMTVDTQIDTTIVTLKAKLLDTLK